MIGVKCDLIIVINNSNKMDITPGKKFLCINDVIMEDDEDLENPPIQYTEGKIYQCEITNCLTNNDGEKNHSWKDVSYFFEYFQPIN